METYEDLREKFVKCLNFPRKNEAHYVGTLLLPPTEIKLVMQRMQKPTDYINSENKNL